jgi:hypothetical protein
MRLIGEFTFLKCEKGVTKESKQEYLIFNFLDDRMDSCRFFVFDSNVINKALKLNLQTYQKLNCVIDFKYFKDSWSPSLLDLEKINNG